RRRVGAGAAPAAPATSQPDSPNGFKVTATGAWGPLGGTFSFARDDKNTSITLGPAEGFGFFGSVGQGAAATESSAQASVQAGAGPISGSLTAGTCGVTGADSTNEPLNPGLDESGTHSYPHHNDGPGSSSYTRGYSFGLRA